MSNIYGYSSLEEALLVLKEDYDKKLKQSQEETICIYGTSSSIKQWKVLLEKYLNVNNNEMG